MKLLIKSRTKGAKDKKPRKKRQRVPHHKKLLDYAENSIHHWTMFRQHPDTEKTRRHLASGNHYDSKFEQLVDKYGISDAEAKSIMRQARKNLGVSESISSPKNWKYAQNYLPSKHKTKKSLILSGSASGAETYGSDNLSKRDNMGAVKKPKVSTPKVGQPESSPHMTVRPDRGYGKVIMMKKDGPEKDASKEKKKKKGRCWDGYKPVKGKKAYSKGSCEPVVKSRADKIQRMIEKLIERRPDLAHRFEKAEKPFHGYSKKKHSKTGGLNKEYREKYNRETGSNLKAPVTEDNPKGKKKKRKKSFCARMSGVKGPTSKDGKLTPKGAALKRWKC